MIVDGGKISLSTATSGTQFKLKEGVQDSLKFISGGNGSSSTPLMSFDTRTEERSVQYSAGYPKHHDDINVERNQGRNRQCCRGEYLAVEAKTTFKHVDFSNSYIPTLPIDGNLTADDVMNNRGGENDI